MKNKNMLLLLALAAGVALWVAMSDDETAAAGDDANGSQGVAKGEPHPSNPAGKIAGRDFSFNPLCYGSNGLITHCGGGKRVYITDPILIGPGVVLT